MPASNKKSGKTWYKCKYCSCEYPTKKLIKMHEDDHQFCNECHHILEFDEGFSCPNDYKHTRNHIIDEVRKRLEKPAHNGITWDEVLQILKKMKK